MSDCTTHHHACECREEKFKEMEADNKQLKAFARDILRATSDGSDIDGGSVQDFALTSGLLQKQIMTEPCSAVYCACVDCGVNFPTDCYRATDVTATPLKESAP